MTGDNHGGTVKKTKGSACPGQESVKIGRGNYVFAIFAISVKRKQNPLFAAALGGGRNYSCDGAATTYYYYYYNYHYH